ncbi:MAG: hypothetical protein Ct9H300mP25_13770 [Acidobacteriota bacterium]|nr:MAG: hypothetical protein Ct9H300mP25_13770 [Acidobacteriota bacterium]
MPKTPTGDAASTSRAPIGKDTVAYKVNGSTDNPFSVDIVLGAGGSSPQIHWDGHGQIGGTWITP